MPNRVSEARQRAGEIVREQGFREFFRKLILAPTNNTLVQMLRYLVVGAVAAIADTGTLMFLAEALNVSDIYAATVGFIVGLIVNYAISVNWVFKRTSHPYAEIVLFALIGAIGLVVNDYTIWAAEAWLAFDLFWAKMLAIVVTFVWNFVLRKILFDRLETMLKSRPGKTTVTDDSTAESEHTAKIDG